MKSIRYPKWYYLTDALGRTIATEESSQEGATDTTGNDGWLSADGWCAGCYLHGLFENDTFRQSIIAALAGQRSTQLLVSERVSFDRQVEYDKLADLLRKHVDMYRLKTLCSLTD